MSLMLNRHVYITVNRLRVRWRVGLAFEYVAIPLGESGTWSRIQDSNLNLTLRPDV